MAAFVILLLVVTIVQIIVVMLMNKVEEEKKMKYVLVRLKKLMETNHVKADQLVLRAMIDEH